VTALNMDAGDNAVQVHTDSGVINVGTNMTVSDVLEIGKSAARTVMLESWPIAEKLIDQRIEIILERIITRIQEKGEHLFERFKDPRFLAVLISVERSFAETGDEELGGVLSGLLVDLAGKPIRTRREIVLRESIECAPKLTTQHLNALSVIFRTTRMTHPLALDVSNLITLLDQDLRPYYGAVPADEFDYNYMGSTQAGTFVRTVGRSIYAAIFHQHRNAMYGPVDANELTELASGTIDDMQALFSEIVQFIEVPHVLGHSSQKWKLRHLAAHRILTTDAPTLHSLSVAENKLRAFIQSRSIGVSQFEQAVREQAPDLAQFLDHLSSTHALSFQLSPVGMMLARHEIETRSPETAAQLDALFED
jgi:hypothetical protein